MAETAKVVRFHKAGEPEVYERIESGKFSPRIDRAFTLSEIVNAHRYLEENQQIGKIVVTV